MRVDEDRAILARVLSPFAIVFASFCLLAAPTVFAQDEGADDQAEIEDDRVVDEVIVTGSRLKRDTYSSISPLQIITGQVSREVGLIDAADILQESTAASGTQIDLSFQGFVLDNGPGSSTISLRGLGEARTLVLVNGRRLAPGGVEGAPFAANLNQIPASLVQQYDLLLDGASSVYGSDAIAGVANVILRKDFDGFEVEGYSSIPDYSNGVRNTLSVVWGKNFDRGFVGFGVEYQDEEAVARKDRPWTSGCDRHHEIDETGQFRSQDVGDAVVLGMAWDDCRRGLLAARIFQDFPGSTGSIYYTPGTSNGGWINFSESSTFGFGIDSDLDGVADLSFRDYDLNGKDSQQNSDLFSATDSLQFMGYGEYTLGGESNITPYFEVLYSDFNFFSNSSEGQLFPSVPALNPYNPCNPAAITGDGVDCGDASDALYNSPNYITQFGNNFEDLCASFGFPLSACTPALFGLQTGPVGAVGVQPIVSVAGDRNTTKVSGDQIRVVGGVRGDMPWLTMGSLENWSFDVYASFSESSAVSERQGIRGDRLDHALGWNSITSTPCVNDLNIELASDVEAGCVPVNMFAASLYPVGVVTDFDTGYEQTIISAYVTGDIFEMPAGGVAFGLGVEHRNDDIASLPDDVARDGLFFGFFSDGGATGDKDTDEIFAEVELPLLAGVPAFEELTVNLSTRYTDDEIYGSGNTESFKLGWRPVESLLIRGTFGTSFRAPNLREVFLENQSGFNNIFDPCYVPEAAINPITGGYDPTLDTRDQNVLTNCLANGVDPTLANNGGFNVFSTEISRGGAPDLNAEESESWSAGFSWDQPFSNAFGLALSATYYEIDVTQTIIEPSGQFIVNDCYNSLTGNSVFCSRIDRDFSDPTDPQLRILDSRFLNRDLETARGVDINLAFDDTFTIFDRPIDVTWDITANRMLERSTLFIDDDGNQDRNTFQGELGFPDWSVRSGLRFDYDNWRLTWDTTYLSSIKQDPDAVDDFSEAITGIGNTCFGPPNDVLCRDYADIDNYFLHNVSVYYYGDRWTLGAGIRNAFDQNPPVVDCNEVGGCVNNTPLGRGYDLRGRTFFMNAVVSFGGGE